MVTLKKGSKGDLVTALQHIIICKADGIFGNDTREAVKSWQKAHGLSVDGIVGEQTWRSIVAVAPTLKRGTSGHWVAALECIIGTLTRDETYSETEIALVKTWQKANGLTADGIVGFLTWSKLLGTSATTNNGANTEKPVDYKQYDSRWKYNVYTSCGNKSQTMSNSGCGPTAVADVVATMKDKSVTPWTLAQLYVKKGYRTTNSGTSWSAMGWTAQQYGFSKFVQTSSFTTMQSCLATGGLVVVSFRASKWTKSGHFCCLWKDDGKYIYVNDPASSSSSRAKGTYAEVQAAAKQYFCYWR